MYGITFHSILNTIRETVKKHDMIKEHDHIVVGVSGGSDSVVLLRALNELKNEIGFTISVAHVNHMVRAGAADEDQMFVESLCNTLGIKCYSLKTDIPNLAKTKGISEEEAGREERYNFFNSIAGRIGKIATAHNMDDNVETAIMRFIRGTSVTGLAGIPYVRENIIRPLMDVKKSDIKNACVEEHWRYCEDFTNSLNIYTRNKIRNNLIPMIEKEFNPNLKKTLAANIESYREDAEFLDSLAEETMMKTFFGTGDRIVCKAEDFQKIPKAIQKRIIIKIIRIISDNEQFDIPANVISSISNILNINVGGHVSLKDGYRVTRKNDEIVFENFDKPVQKELTKVILDMNHVNRSLNLGTCLIDIEDITTETPIENTSNICYIPYEYYKNGSVHSMLFIRPRVPGDKFRINSRMHKKISDVMNLCKIPVEKREFTPCLFADNECLWIMGHKSTRWDCRTGRFVKITITE